ncbi:MAG TPA: TrmH family RNA methyltransferase [Candidatus Limnocylindrales bacterium]|nr:TrmH family RNA methyltransferase [Candidatus Limnocylindrales bacterium]
MSNIIPTKITRPNGKTQQWQSLLTNRNKRVQSKKFIVEGVRPINTALSQNYEVDSVLYLSTKLSDWATNIINHQSKAKHYELSPDMMQKLSIKNDSLPELLLIVRNKELPLSKIKINNLRSNMVLVLDRPQNPGNIGAVIRSADALGAALVIIVGHSADIYDPKSVRASRGSLFALPVIAADSPKEVQAWATHAESKFTIVGLSEDGSKDLWDYNLTHPTVAVIGNETWGLSKQWKEVADSCALIPMKGTASSLNAASSAAIVMYEYARQCR